MQNLNTIKSLRHSKDKRNERLERFKYFPKGAKMYNKSKGIISPPKEKLLYGECVEVESDVYRNISNKTYLIRNGNTYKIMNAVTTQLFKKVRTNTSQQSKDNILEVKENIVNTYLTLKYNETKSKIKSKTIKVVIIMTFIIFAFQILYERFLA